MNTANAIVERLISLSDEEKIAQAKYFGVKGGIVLGISAPEIRSISKEIKINHPLALELWQKEYHEARMIATLIADKNKITSKQMDAWTEDFDNWAIVDAACYNLYRYTPFAEEKIFQYCKSEKEYIRRTSFSLIAGLAIGVKKMPDEEFLKFLPLIEEYAFDERNFVWKAVNWALRQTGKRSLYLHPYALELAQKLSLSSNSTHRKIGKDAFRELSNPKTIARIKK